MTQTQKTYTVTDREGKTYVIPATKAEFDPLRASVVLYDGDEQVASFQGYQTCARTETIQPDPEPVLPPGYDDSPVSEPVLPTGDMEPVADEQ